MKNNSQSSNEFAILADSFVRQIQDGESPSIEEFANAHPEMAEKIHELFPAMVLIEELAPGANEIDVQPAEPIEDLGYQRLGDYELVHEIGRGGMGIVYLANQRSLQRRVALKVLPQRGRQEKSAIERFRFEAQAAAQLHHPHIVPVFEVGEDRGQRFYAMQLIKGQSLDEVLKELRQIQSNPKLVDSIEQFSEPTARRQSSIAQSLWSNIAEPSATDSTDPDSLAQIQCETEHIKSRNTKTSISKDRARSNFSKDHRSKSHYFRSIAELCLQAASALAYAHANGIFHRDIKPSNLLLDSASHIWITDFGLAKSVGTDLTQSGDLVGTLNYMAPERFQGWSDPRSDVYGLGVTLFELATLQPAFENSDRLGLIHEVLNQTPPRPSAIDYRIPRDLETIILKAIEKEPARRYPSANDMAGDLERFLQDKPLKARRSGRIERSVRLCRRNPVVTSLVVFLAAALIGGLAATSTLWMKEKTQRQIAQANARDAQIERGIANEAVDLFLAKMSQSKLGRLPGTEPLRKELLELALQYYTGFVERHRDHDHLNHELANTYYRMGRVSREIGSHREAISHFGQALAIRDSCSVAISEIENRSLRAQILNEIGFAEFSLGNQSRAEESFERAIQLQQSCLESEPNNVHFMSELADIFTNRGIAQSRHGHFDYALSSFEQALDIRHKLVLEIPDSAKHQTELMTVLNNIGAHHLQHGNSSLAMVSLSQANELVTFDLSTQRSITGDLPQSTLDQIILLKHNLGVLHAELGEIEKAEKAYLQSLNLKQLLVDRNPNLPDFRRAAAKTQRNLAYLYRDIGNTEQAVQMLDAAIENWRWLVDVELPVGNRPFDLPKCYSEASFLVASRGETQRAIKYGRRAVEFSEWLLTKRNDSLAAKLSLAESQRGLASLLIEAGRLSEAQKVAEESQQFITKLVSEFPHRQDVRQNIAASHRQLCELYRAMNQLDRAISHANRALSEYGRLPDYESSEYQYNAWVGRANMELGTCLLKKKHASAAGKAFACAIECFSQWQEQQPWNSICSRRLAKATANLATAELQQSNVREAIDLFEKACDAFESLCTEHPQIDSHFEDLANIRFALGHVYLKRGNVQQSLVCFQKSAEAWKAISDRRRDETSLLEKMATSYSLVGTMHLKLDRPQLAVKPLRTAQLIYDNLLNLDSDPKVVVLSCGTLSNLAAAQLRNGEPETAIRIYEQAIETLAPVSIGQHPPEQAIEFLANLYSGYTKALVSENEFEQALAVTESNLELILANQLASKARAAYRMQASILTQLNRHEEAQRALEEAAKY